MIAEITGNKNQYSDLTKNETKIKKNPDNKAKYMVLEKK